MHLNPNESFGYVPLCQRNMVGSLPRGMPKVVDYRQTDAQATNKMVTQDRHEVDLAVVFPSTLAPVIITAITLLITQVAVAVGIIALVAAIKIVVPTTVAAVVIAVWG